MDIAARAGAWGMILEAVTNTRPQERTNSDHHPVVLEIPEAGPQTQRKISSEEEDAHPQPTPRLQITTKVAATDENDKATMTKPIGRNPPLALLALNYHHHHQPTQKFAPPIQKSKLPPSAAPCLLLPPHPTPWNRSSAPSPPRTLNPARTPPHPSPPAAATPTSTTSAHLPPPKSTPTSSPPTTPPPTPPPPPLPPSTTNPTNPTTAKTGPSPSKPSATAKPGASAAQSA